MPTKGIFNNHKRNSLPEDRCLLISLTHTMEFFHQVNRLRIALIRLKVAVALSATVSVKMFATNKRTLLTNSARYKFYLPYCVVRIISKFRMGSLVGRTSNSSITTEFTFLLESADSALTALIIFP